VNVDPNPETLVIRQGTIRDFRRQPAIAVFFLDLDEILGIGPPSIAINDPEFAWQLRMGLQ
jgi:hypothetical protein